MVLAPLPFAISLLGAAALLATGKIIPPRLREAVAILCSAAVCAICCLLLIESSNHPIVYWFGGWEPHQDVAVGIAFTITPVGAGLAALASVLVTTALVFSWKY